MKKSIVTAHILFLVIFQNIAQQRIKFEQLSVDKGLSQSSILSIVQDNQGFIWFSTLDGLNKYDGYKFKVYWTKPNTPNVITDNISNVLYETPDKENPTLWVGTADHGLCRYNKVSDDFTPFKHSSEDVNSLSNNKVTSIIGNNAALWIGTNSGLNKYDGKKFSRHSLLSAGVSDTITCMEQSEHTIWIGTQRGFVLFDTKTETLKKIKNNLPDKKINSISAGANGAIWVGTEDGIYTLSDTQETTHFASQEFDYEVKVIETDKDGTLWIGTVSDGLFHLIPESKQFYKYIFDAADKYSISANSILTIYRDRADILWIGTSLGGVNKWNRAANDLMVFKHNPYDAYSLSAAQVRCFHIDTDSTVWVGTVEGGLNRWDKTTNRFKHFKHNSKNPNSLPNNHVRTIFEDSVGNFWLGTDGGGLSYFDRKKGTFKTYKHDSKNPKSIPSNRVWDIVSHNPNTLIIATFGGGLALFDLKSEQFTTYKSDKNNPYSLTSDEVTTILKSKKGELYVGTFSGLNLFYPDNKEGKPFLRFEYEADNNKSLSNNRVYSLLEDSEGNLWVGTKGGLNVCTPSKSYEFQRLTIDNSELPNNVMLGILEDGEYIWVSTNSGISRIRKNEKQIKNFDMGDGLQSNEFLANSAHKSPTGEMFFGGIDGFNAFYPEKIKDNPHQPSVLITSVEVKNKLFATDTAFSMKKVIELEYNQNDVSFEFVALDFIFPEKNRYAYQLIGYDKELNYIDFQRFAKYTNLPPGTYTFRVIGSNNDNVWNEEGASLTLIIHPAFWQTLWFKILSVALIIFAAVAFYRIRVRAIKRQNEYLEDQVRKRTAEIRQQNEEIKAQRDEITIQKNHIEKQKQEIEDSIIYAKRIQTAAMPARDYMEKNLPEHFVLFKPRDIVSGDFFWASRKDDKIIITAADCTGHGVPGAFMSMLGISFLNKIVNERGVTNPAEILNQLRNNIIQALKQDEQSDDKSKDGMDISLIVIDLSKKKMLFSGAFNPIFLVKNKEAKTIDADRMPVAIYESLDSFTIREFDLSEADMVYLSSDGYPDQFGGEKGKKFMKARFRTLLTEISDKDMQTQHSILDKTIEQWRGSEAQVDDIVVVGVKLSKYNHA